METTVSWWSFQSGVQKTGYFGRSTSHRASGTGDLRIWGSPGTAASTSLTKVVPFCTNPRKDQSSKLDFRFNV